MHSEAHNRRVSCHPMRAGVGATENRLEWEVWSMVPAGKCDKTDSDIVFFKSAAHDESYLKCCPCGKVEVTDQRLGWEKWRLVQANRGTEERDCGFLYRIQSDAHPGRFLAMKSDGHIHADGDLSQDNRDLLWRLEINSGQLVMFRTSTGCNKNLSCDWSGNLEMKTNRKGWEVWRVISVPESKTDEVFINSWTHLGKNLSSHPDGRLFTTCARGGWEKWRVIPLETVTVPEEHGGHSRAKLVLIQNSHHKHRFLAWKDGQIRALELHKDGVEDLYTRSEEERIQFLQGLDLQSSMQWQLASPNDNTYFLSSPHTDRRIGASNEGVFHTTNRLGWEEWRLEAHPDRLEEGVFNFRNLAHNRYLGSKPEGDLMVQPHKQAWEEWQLVRAPRGGFFIRSFHHQDRFLRVNEENNRIYTEHVADGNFDNILQVDHFVWNLEPKLPGTISGPQALTIGAAALGALGMAIAAPFAVMGVVGAMGFTSGGIAAGSMAAGMMSAEAVAAGGAIAAGGTVATLQSIGAAGLGVGGVLASVGVGAGLGAVTVGGTSYAVLNTRDTLGGAREDVTVGTELQ